MILDILLWFCLHFQPIELNVERFSATDDAILDFLVYWGNITGSIHLIDSSSPTLFISFILLPRLCSFNLLPRLSIFHSFFFTDFLYFIHSSSPCLLISFVLLHRLPPSYSLFFTDPLYFIDSSCSLRFSRSCWPVPRPRAPEAWPAEPSCPGTTFSCTALQQQN